VLVIEEYAKKDFILAELNMATGPQTILRIAAINKMFAHASLSKHTGMHKIRNAFCAAPTIKMPP
jgi:hypothetical protein